MSMKGLKEDSPSFIQSHSRLLLAPGPEPAKAKPEGSTRWSDKIRAGAPLVLQAQLAHLELGEGDAVGGLLPSSGSSGFNGWKSLYNAAEMVARPVLCRTHYCCYY
ncbi:hypothetical protein Anapl_00371 [Anas platyrhynchos]|uniref:Uncharacterized protein n=1 Tax=Anas platyrhynchos TaxID=8839 RepID=R0JV24_ANAPL|nr:hypothetical protein Anapl_00371 [Anas platyrhynchos]